MIKIKRINNLKILKEKKLNVQRNEVLTLVKELDKIKTINERLKNILANVKKKKITNARDLSDTNNFNIKIIDQIHVSDNRIKFLKEEIKRSRKNLGNLMQHKKVIKNKIDYLTRLQIDKIEKRTEENIPNTRKP